MDSITAILGITCGLAIYIGAKVIQHKISMIRHERALKHWEENMYTESFPERGSNFLPIDESDFDSLKSQKTPE